MYRLVTIQKWQAYIRSVLYQNLKQCLTAIATLAAADPHRFPPCYRNQSDFASLKKLSKLKSRDEITP